MDDLTNAIATTTNAMGDLNISVMRTHSAAKGGGEVVQSLGPMLSAPQSATKMRPQ